MEAKLNDEALTYEDVIDGGEYDFNMVSHLKGWLKNVYHTEYRADLLKDLDHKTIKIKWGLSDKQSIDAFVISPEAASFLSLTDQY